MSEFDDPTCLRVIPAVVQYVLFWERLGVETPLFRPGRRLTGGELDVLDIVDRFLLTQGRVNGSSVVCDGHHGGRVRRAKLPCGDAAVEEEVDLLQRLALALRDAEVDKDDGESHDGAEDEANLAVETGILVVDEIGNAEVDSETGRRSGMSADHSFIDLTSFLQRAKTARRLQGHTYLNNTLVPNATRAV